MEWIHIVNDYSSYWVEMDRGRGNLRSREIHWNTVVMGIYSELYQRYLVQLK